MKILISSFTLRDLHACYESQIKFAEIFGGEPVSLTVKNVLKGINNGLAFLWLYHKLVGTDLSLSETDGHLLCSCGVCSNERYEADPKFVKSEIKRHIQEIKHSKRARTILRSVS